MKAENTTKIQFDSLSVNESYARGAAAAFLARYDPTVPQLADIKTAVSEAVTNCIVHAYPDAIGPVTLSIAVYPERLVKITVTDKGIGIPNVEKAMDMINFAVASSAIKHTIHGDANITDEVSSIRNLMNMNYDIKR